MYFSKALSKALFSVLPLLYHLLIFFLVFTPTLSLANNPLPITPDGTTNTSVISAPNGVPVVNIAAPSGSGLS